MKLFRIITFTLLVTATLGGIGMFGFLYSGIYDIAAVHPHTQLTRFLLTTLKRNAIANYSDSEIVPENLDQASLIKRGFILYRAHCVSCHGAPGEERGRMGIGLNPNPPPLEKAAIQWKPHEITWIIKKGIKMAGMPGFELGEEPQDIWALTAFVLRINTLDTIDYLQMVAYQKGKVDESSVHWQAPALGWKELEEKGDLNKGRTLLYDYGCGSCHVIPGVAGARGRVGPPLGDWARRHYISGSHINAPIYLIPWLMNPQKLEPGTLMPDLDVQEHDAWHMARYLYNLNPRTKPDSPSLL